MTQFNFFKNREDAGKRLAEKIPDFSKDEECIIIALPRGGVVVGYELVKQLKIPMDIIIPRKISSPFNPELAIGAIAETENYFDNDLIESLNVSDEYLETEIQKEKKEAERRKNLYRKNRPPLNLEDKTVILVDDGIATGSTVIASIQYIKTKNPKKIILAVPVAPPEVVEKIEKLVDQVICLYQPDNFLGIGQFFEHFDQVDDKTVTGLMDL